MTPLEELEAAARARVMSSEALVVYADTIFHHWPDYATHLQWVIDAPEGELADWAMRIAHGGE